MEILTAASYANAPRATTSHLRERVASAVALQQSSQDSLASVASSGSSIGPRFQPNSSNASQLTDFTAPASPTSSAESGPAPVPERQPSRLHMPRDKTPEGLHGGFDGAGDNVLASPMSIVSPVATNGAKRTASGHVKNAPSLPNTPFVATFAGSASRRASTSSTSSRAGELAAALRARLGYAALKVQHGWEHKSIAEVERLAARAPSRHRHTHSYSDQRPGTSGLSQATANLSTFDPYGRPAPDGPSSPPSKRHSLNFSSQPRLEPAPRLQPSADIRPNTYPNRDFYSFPPTHFNSAMSPPRTPNSNPAARRPPTLRTETQTMEAERDALQALFQLGSPHTSQLPRHPSVSQGSSSQASPLRAEFATPRRVTFARSESADSGRQSSSASSVHEAQQEHFMRSTAAR